MKIHNRLNKYYLFRKILNEKLNRINQKVDKCKDESNKTQYITLHKITEHTFKSINKKIKIIKDTLYEEFKATKQFNYKNRDIRELNQEYLNIKNVISVFESTLTRVMQVPIDTLTEDLIIVQTYFFEIIEDLILDGFMLKGEKYTCLTASAGQIRTKKTVFIKESQLKRYYDTLSCGLTIERINECGGVNINKYLAYLALNNSATDEWKDFDITKTIVVDDFETDVKETVDLIDDETYTIERVIKDVPIPHMDGCGIMLPKLGRNRMFRSPWVKGLLISSPFNKFIREKSKELGKYCGIVKDIYGKEHDILKEKIEIIFTKSQFKMWKYYKSWEEYIDNFIKYNCQAGTCNEEEDKFQKAKINYQMLQTLTDITDTELQEISKKTINKIKNISNDKNTMLKVLGVTSANRNKNYLQQSLEIYPELLNDTYNKEILKNVKKSLVKEGRAGKLDIDAIYTFLAPDTYAFCEWLFLHEENPKGLLQNGEVWCSFYDNKPELDCLRSPHLYREHAVRKNVAYKSEENEDRIKEMKRWFNTKAIYTSTHDIISKILMFDVDGDKSLVCAEPLLVEVAKRNMKGIVPLYYNMRKAEPTIINSQSIYNGLKSAYTGGNIGEISNNISKIWNSDNADINVIKLLCMENNFTIDFAKTLYKPQRPKKMKKIINQYTKLKVPHFFIYAKDKDNSKVETINNSVVNRLEKTIPNPRISFKNTQLGKFDYNMLMHNKKVKMDKKIIDKYTELDLKKPFLIGKNKDGKVDNVVFLYQDIKNQLLEVYNDEVYITDVLIKYLYGDKKAKFKTTLWECFGNIIVENLKLNIKNKLKGTIQCEKCGKRIKVSNNRIKYCAKCAKEINIKKTANNRKKRKSV
ncbi:hypothetical protein [Clostridium botulinum]|nr:hypothetical protein [Clostridium botulinum]MCD3232654.1 hypothetical protein [Clostridium botulinum D/C]MCD3238417.1 hypothetical protein [Clostridium botulinum D/C]MCD3266063.1 hypothetical protein [Clostridium botulinum D/C]MCD3304302.1 hypothetical protein [Clostridium botulinum D/C]MCD3313052.1 hypothetical protein [Clostridium botulinum D/C]